MEDLGSFPRPRPVHLFHPALPEICPLIINPSSGKSDVSLSSVSRSRKLAEQEEEIVGASNP